MTEFQSGEQGQHPASHPSPDPRGQLVLDEARRGIDQQKKDLEGLRNRGLAVLGTAAALVSLALQRAPDSDLALYTRIGIALCIACGVVGAVVIAPRTFSFSFNVELMDERIDEGATFDQMARDTALGLHRDYGENKMTLEWMHAWFFASLLLLGLETAALLIGLR